MRNVKITITGDLGSGKSTVCALIAKKMNLKIYSMGGIQRELAEKYGMDTLNFNIYAENHPEIDDEIDGFQAKLSDEPSDIIVDSRMGWHFVKNTFKIYLSVDIEEAAKRIMDHHKAGGRKEDYQDINEAIEKIRERKKRENYRYKQKYGVNCQDLGQFDLVVDTTDKSSDEVSDRIITEYQKWREAHD